MGNNTIMSSFRFVCNLMLLLSAVLPTSSSPLPPPLPYYLHTAQTTTTCALLLFLFFIFLIHIHQFFFFYIVKHWGVDTTYLCDYDIIWTPLPTQRLPLLSPLALSSSSNSTTFLQVHKTQPDPSLYNLDWFRRTSPCVQQQRLTFVTSTSSSCNCFC